MRVDADTPFWAQLVIGVLICVGLEVWNRIEMRRKDDHTKW